MPWHDLGIRMEGGATEDLAVNFIERWTAHKTELGEGATLLATLPAPTHSTVEVRNIL